MKPFRYLPHTADMRFRAYGKNFPSAMENSALALLNVMLDIRRIKKDGSKKSSVIIKESADNETEMAWFVLQDILSKVDSRKLNAYAFKVSQFKCGKKIKLTGRLMCKKTKKDYALLSVKAVTPHNLKVSTTKKVCTVEVVIDV